LTKGADAISRAAGVAGGGAVAGTPGAIAGGLAGPTLFKKLFPEPAAQAAAREEFLKAKTLTEAQEKAIAINEKLNAQKDKAQKTFEKQRDQYYTEKGEAIQRRGREVEKMETAATKAENAANRARREAQKSTIVGKEPIGPEIPPELDYEQRAQDLMERQKQQDALDKQATQARKEAEDAKQKARDEEKAENDRIAKLHADHAKNLKSIETERQKELGNEQKLRDIFAKSLKKGSSSQSEQPAAAPKAEEAPKAAPEKEPVESGKKPQDLVRRPKRIVVPGEEPTPEELKTAGDYTQTPIERLRLLDKMGDRVAHWEIVRRQKNSP
jgi:hypothetical protein